MDMKLFRIFGKKRTQDGGGSPSPNSFERSQGIDDLINSGEQGKSSTDKRTSFVEDNLSSSKEHEKIFREDDNKNFINQGKETPLESNSPLLDNMPWVKLVEELIALQETLGKQRKKVSPEAQDFLDYALDKIDELLLRNGLKRIDDESTFDRLRHQCVSGQVAEDGAHITETLALGLCLGERVFKRAQVIIEKEKIDE